MPDTEGSGVMDENMSSSSSDSDDDDEMKDDAQEEEISKLLQEVETSPYSYDSHTRLIALLKEAGSMETLREARERMNKYFPLSPELWLAWIKDEYASGETDEEKERLVALCDRAVGEYTSVDVWLEYCQLMIGFLGAEDGPARVRAVFERALTAVGLHVTKGSLIWEAYREFENIMYNTIKESGGSETGAARDRVTTLYRRQLRVPLLHMEMTYAEYESWLSTQQQPADENVEREYRKALEKLKLLLPVEDKLAGGGEVGGGSVPAYQEYLRHELTDGTPARVQNLLERAVTDNCLSLELWQSYTRYLDFELRPAPEVTLAVHERAVRNLPWAAVLWEQYIRAAERAGEDMQRVEGLVSRALGSGLQSSQDYQLVWLAWLDFFRRHQIKQDAKPPELMEKMRIQFTKACEHLAQTFGLEGDPECVLLQYWAGLEATNGDLDRATQLWNDILSQGHDRSAKMWLQYIRLVQRFGTVKQVRRLLVRAMERTVDWPESIYELWAQFERETGSLETWDDMTYRYRVRMKHVEGMRKKQAEKEEDQLKKAEAKTEKKRQKDREWKKNKRQSSKQTKTEHQDSDSSPRKRKFSNTDEITEGQTSEARETTTGQKPSAGFKVPPPPGYKATVPPPPGFRPPHDDQPDNKRPRVEESSEAGSTGDVERDSRTVFVSNLDFSTSEEHIRQHFSAAGDIAQLRLVKDYKGRSKGFAYLEFTSIAGAESALKMDRQPMAGRPCFVSTLKRSKAEAGEPFAFKYGTGLQKNKLFLRGLAPSVTQEHLREVYEVYGELVDVRLVTYRNGHTKGIAYVEFKEESAASQALLKTDGMELGGRHIKVAYSDPPKPKSTRTKPEPKAPTGRFAPRESALGRAPRGRGRVQVAFTPRVVQQKGDPRPASGVGPQDGSARTATQDSSAHTSANGDSSQQQAAAPKSNADFRAQLLQGR